MPENEKQKKLSEKLSHNMRVFLSDAHKAVVKSGTLGAGMSIDGSADAVAEFDDDSITVTGTVVVKIFRKVD